MSFTSYTFLPGSMLPPDELVEESRREVISRLFALGGHLPAGRLDGLTVQAAKGAWRVLEEESDTPVSG